jgi:hypothetical protein
VLLGADTVHQGALLETEPLPEPDLAELRTAAAAGRSCARQVTTRTTSAPSCARRAVFGAAGLVMTRRHSPPLEARSAKSASGAPRARAGGAGAEPGAARLRRVEGLGLIVIASTEKQPTARGDRLGRATPRWCWARRQGCVS